MPFLSSTRRHTARTHFVAFLLAIGLGTLVEPAHAQLSSGCTGIDGENDTGKNAFYQMQINNANYVWNSGETIRATWTNPTTDPTTAYLKAGASAAPGVAASVAQTTSAALTGTDATVLSLTLSADRTYVRTDLDAGNGNYAIECGLLQTITFNQPAEQTLGSDVNLTATASSGLAVSFTSNTPAICTVAGATVTPQSSGTCTITSTQAGNATYYAAADVARSFAIRGTQTITFDQPADLTLGNNVDLTASASSGLAVSFTSSTGAVCTVAGNTVTSQSAGTCTITASQAGDANFLAAADVARSFAIRGTQTITFDQPADLTLGNNVDLTASASSGLAVSFTSSTGAVCTVAGNTVTSQSAGTCTITASQAGDANFLAAADVARSFAIRGTQTITFDQPTDLTLGNNVDLTASASSGLAVSFTSSTGAVCTVAGNTVTSQSAGTCTITASQAGNANFLAAADVARSFAIRGTQTITFDQPTDLTLGNNVDLTASASSGLAVSFTSSTGAVCTVAGNTVTSQSAGTCTITASQAGNANFLAAADVARSFAIRGTQTITFDQPTDLTLGNNVDLTASASSGLAVSFTSSTGAVCTVAGNTVTSQSAGTCTITASQAGGANFLAAADVARSFAIRGTQTITFDQPADLTLGNNVDLTASASSGLAVSFTSSTGAVCTVAGNTVTSQSAGTCTITASQAGGGNFLAAADVARSFAIRGTQTITFDQPTDLTLGNNVDLTASASSGLAVSFTSSTGAVCTVAGNTVTSQSAGTCTITASQAGGGNFLAAADVARSFAIRGTQTITFDQPADLTLGNNVDLTATASSGLAVSFTSSTGAVCTVAGNTVTSQSAGTCTITASQAGGGNFLAAADVARSFAINGTQTITFDQPADLTLGNNVDLTATASSGLAVSYTSSTTDVCTVSGNTVTSQSAGTCTITASQAGGGNFLAAADVARSFAINGTQTITFDQPADLTLGNNVDLTATASSGLAVSYTSSTAGGLHGSR